jgi:hypothetical protein
MARRFWSVRSQRTVGQQLSLALDQDQCMIAQPTSTRMGWFRDGQG